MGDHFTLLVDRLLTESTLEATIESQRLLHLAATSASKITAAEFSHQKMDFDLKSCPKKLVDCRICHEEDEDSNMEMPCSCCGSLKYAHRKCVQRWCNEKGDTICEICRQQFKHGYTAPPPLFHYSRIPMTFRGNLEIPRRDIHSHRFMDIVPSNHEFLDSDFEDYSAHSPRSLLCCRIVAIIFMVLLVLRHTLPIVISGAEDYSLRLFMLVLLRTMGILLPIYVVVKAFTNVNRRRHQPDPHLSIDAFDEETELTQL